MDTLLTAFEVVSLTAIGGSVLAVGAFEITDTIEDFKRSVVRVASARKAAPRLHLLATSSPAIQAQAEPISLAKAA